MSIVDLRWSELADYLLTKFDPHEPEFSKTVSITGIVPDQDCSLLDGN